MNSAAPHAIVSAHDLDAACSLLSRGVGDPWLNRQYVHPGDLKWWIYSWLRGEGISDAAFVWRDAETPEIARGCALFFPWASFSVFVDPCIAGSIAAREFFDWAEARASSIALAGGKGEVQCVNVAGSNENLLVALRTRGYAHVPEDLILMSTDLKTTRTSAQIPDGFFFRRVEPSDIAARAEAQHRAFSSRLPLEEYQRNYSRFSQSPGYPVGTDLMVVSPDGRVAGFCIVWPDAESRVGLVEPVGVDPDFRSLGLVTSVLLHGLDVLRSRGMKSARVTGC